MIHGHDCLSYLKPHTVFHELRIRSRNNGRLEVGVRLVEMFDRLGFSSLLQWHLSGRIDAFLASVRLGPGQNIRVSSGGWIWIDLKSFEAWNLFA
jgi:hypothetical protein